MNNRAPRRTTLVLEASLWLAAVLMVAGLLWDRWSLQPAPERNPLWATRPTEAHILMTPHIGEDRITVRGDYTLLDRLPESRLLFWIPGPVIWAIADDARGRLAVYGRDLDSSWGYLWVDLRSSAAGYTFTLSYDLQTVSTGLRSMGAIELLLSDGDADTHLTWVIPTSDPIVVLADGTDPQPQEVSLQPDGVHVRFDLADSDRLQWAYGPEGGLLPLPEKRLRRVVSILGVDYEFVIVYPPGAEEVIPDVLDFADRLFPLLVEELGGAGPPTKRFTIILQPDVPAPVWAAADYAPAFGQISIYLRVMDSRPSGLLVHEMMHSYMRGSAPVFMQEGLARYFSQRVLWRAGLSSWRQPADDLREEITPTLLLQEDRGSDIETIGEGYRQGERLIAALEESRRVIGWDLPREMVMQLRDRRATLQSVICGAEHGAQLYYFLRVYGLQEGLHLPADCTPAETVALLGEPSAGPPGWLPSAGDRWRLLWAAVAAIGTPVGALFVAGHDLLSTWRALQGTFHPARYLLGRFLPALASGLIAGALWTRLVVALWLHVRRAYRRAALRPPFRSFWRYLPLNAMILALPLIGLCVRWWGPMVAPCALGAMAPYAVELWCEGCLFAAAPALVELWIHGLVR